MVPCARVTSTFNRPGGRIGSIFHRGCHWPHWKVQEFRCITEGESFGGLVGGADLTSYHEFQFGTNLLAVHFSELLEPWRLQNMKIRPLYDRVVIKRVEVSRAE